MNRFNNFGTAYKKKIKKTQLISAKKSDPSNE